MAFGKKKLHEEELDELRDEKRKAEAEEEVNKDNWPSVKSCVSDIRQSQV